MIWFLIRCFIGLIFVLSGFPKLLAPYQDFVAVINAYELVPLVMAKPIALGLPWLELIAGVFAVLGHRIKVALSTLLGMTLMFLFVVGQAMIRQLPVEECGCFGEGFSIPLPGVFVFDTLMLIALIYLLRHGTKAATFSLDNRLS